MASRIAAERAASARLAADRANAEAWVAWVSSTLPQFLDLFNRAGNPGQERMPGARLPASGWRLNGGGLDALYLTTDGDIYLSGVTTAEWSDKVTSRRHKKVGTASDFAGVIQRRGKIFPGLAAWSEWPRQCDSVAQRLAALCAQCGVDWPNA